jgi:hypothetical protein
MGSQCKSARIALADVVDTWILLTLNSMLLVAPSARIDYPNRYRLLIVTRDYNV